MMTSVMSVAEPLQSTAATYQELDLDLTETAERIRMRVRRATADIIANGNDLIRVRTKLGHGNFLSWLDSELGMEPRTAQRWMSLAELAQDKNDIVSYLPPTIAYRLAAPSTPKAVVEKIVEKITEDIDCGSPVDIPVIEAQLEEARRARKETTRAARMARRRSVSRRTQTRREAQRRAEEAFLLQQTEAARLVAHNLFAGLGLEHSETVLAAYYGANSFNVFAEWQALISKAREGAS